MSYYTAGDVVIRYEESGEGYAVLLLANGAMESTIEAWERTTVNPLKILAGDFRLVAMDQRNAGSSRGPLPLDDPWSSYALDQLGLMDHLGIDRFLVMGCCIGGPYALKLIEVAPERIAAAVIEQPIGVNAENRGRHTAGRAWIADLVSRRDDLSEADGTRFIESMWDDKDFLYSVTREVVRTCQVPLLVLPGSDLAHPREIGLELAALAPNAELIDPWKETPALAAEAALRVRAFLHRYAGGKWE